MKTCLNMLWNRFNQQRKQEENGNEKKRATTQCCICCSAIWKNLLANERALRPGCADMPVSTHYTYFKTLDITEIVSKSAPQTATTFTQVQIP